MYGLIFHLFRAGRSGFYPIQGLQQNFRGVTSFHHAAIFVGIEYKSSSIW